jgi:hypothetical protein
VPETHQQGDVALEEHQAGGLARLSHGTGQVDQLAPVAPGSLRMATTPPGRRSLLQPTRMSPTALTSSSRPTAARLAGSAE